MAIRYTDEALGDLFAIIDDGFDHDLANPIAYADLLQERIAQLDTLAHPGRAGRVEGTREWVITGTSYIASTVHDGDGVIVLGLMHGARRWPAAGSG